jgi:uncharacterized protein YceK
MPGTRVTVLAVLSALLLSGCGTVTNLTSEKPDCYGGVQHDIQILATPRPQPEGIGISNLGFLVLFVDLPLSFVGDTLTMPLAVYQWHRGEDQTETSSPNPGIGSSSTAPAANPPGNNP